MYTIAQHQRMLTDETRVRAYAAALERVVCPGSIVADIGTGVGIFALLALRYGASRVYAIEPDEVIEVAQKVAAENGCAHQISFIQDLSTNVSLPERVDVIVSDLHGVTPFFRGHIPAIIDARRRMLEPGGTVVPALDSLWAAPTDAPEQFERFSCCGFRMESAQQYLTNNWRKVRIRRDQLLVRPSCVAVLDYSSIESPNLRAQFRCTTERAGTLHGLTVWFDAELVPGILISNAPGERETVYANAFFPVSEPVAVSPGFDIAVMLAADLVGEDYVWRWRIRVLDGHKTVAEFSQDTFAGSPLSRTRLRALIGQHAREPEQTRGTSPTTT